MGSIDRFNAAGVTESPKGPATPCPDRQHNGLQQDRRRAALGLLGLAAGFRAAATPVAAGAASLAATSFYANFQGLKLLDQNGARLQVERLALRTVLVNFVYTGCSTVCPLQTRALAELQRQLPAPVRQRFQLLSISLDPLSDTPQALHAFATRMGADLTGWTFATGRPEDVEKLSEALRLFRPGPETRRPEEHSTALWLVDWRGQLRMRYSGNPPDVPRLLREVAAIDQTRAQHQS